MPQANITVLGSINMDLVFRTPRMPKSGETLSGHEFLQIAGGKGANQAVAAARQGAAVHLIACVGNDEHGATSLRGLEAEAIATDLISTTPDAATGVAGIFVDDAGNNSIVIAPGANALMSLQQIDKARPVIAKSALFICQLETPLNTVEHAITLASQEGVPVIFNPAPVCRLRDSLLAKVTYLVVNETEAEQLSGIPVTDHASAHTAAQRLRERGARIVLLTMGAEGVCIADADSSTIHPAIPVTAVDSTAAGDTFVGAFAHAITLGLTLQQACNEAQHAAALAVTKTGAQTSIPYRHQVISFMHTTSANKSPETLRLKEQ